MKLTKLVIPAVLLGFVFAMQACAGIEERVVDAINIYCGEAATTRQAVRESVNTALAESGHSVLVTCAGDE